MSWTLTEIIQANRESSEKLLVTPYRHYEGPGGVFLVTDGFLPCPEPETHGKKCAGLPCYTISQFDPETGNVRVLRKDGKLWGFTTRKSAYRRAEAIANGLSRNQLVTFPFVPHSHLR